MKPNHKGSAQIFKNPVLEQLTRTHIAIPITIFIVIAAALIAYGYANGFISVLSALGLFFIGWFIFTFVEYMAHRYLFHMDTDTEMKKNIQYTFHGNHHDYPKDKRRLAMPPIVSLLLASFFFFLFPFVENVGVEPPPSRNATDGQGRPTPFPLRSPFPLRGECRSRTDDLLLAKQAL